MIASSYTLAACVMSVIVSFIGMPLGRRNCILLGDVFVIVGGALQASSWSVPQIIISRVLCVRTLIIGVFGHTLNMAIILGVRDRINIFDRSYIHGMLVYPMHYFSWLR